MICINHRHTKPVKMQVKLRYHTDIYDSRDPYVCAIWRCPKCPQWGYIPSLDSSEGVERFLTEHFIE